MRSPGGPGPGARAHNAGSGRAGFRPRLDELSAAWRDAEAALLIGRWQTARAELDRAGHPVVAYVAFAGGTLKFDGLREVRYGNYTAVKAETTFTAADVLRLRDGQNGRACARRQFLRSRSWVHEGNGYHSAGSRSDGAGRSGMGR